MCWNAVGWLLLSFLMDHGCIFNDCRRCLHVPRCVATPRHYGYLSICLTGSQRLLFIVGACRAERSPSVCPQFKLQLEECLSAERVPTPELIQGYIKKVGCPPSHQKVLFFTKKSQQKENKHTKSLTWSPWSDKINLWSYQKGRIYIHYPHMKACHLRWVTWPWQLFLPPPGLLLMQKKYRRERLGFWTQWRPKRRDILAVLNTNSDQSKRQPVPLT